MKKQLLIDARANRATWGWLPIALFLFVIGLASFRNDRNEPRKQERKQSATSTLPIKKAVAHPLDADPIKFTMLADKQSVSAGEEVTITITAHYLNINSALLFTLAGTNAFRLNVLLPDDFVQTGGDYTDYIGTELSATQPTATYTLKGYFTKAGSKHEFRLLRGAYNADINSLFVEKARLSIRLNTLDLRTQQQKSARAGNCNYTEGQYLFTFNTEQMYAHYYNGILYAGYQDGGNFRPQHWLTATSMMDASTASCFAENDPHTTTTNPSTGNGSGNGLLGNYFNNQTLSGSPALSRIDATINFSWNESGSPFPGVNATNMSVRWEGQVEAPVSGDYTFSTNNDDATNLWVNGQQLISDWPGGHGVLLKSGTIHLDANQKYSVKLEFNQGGGGAQAQLLWSYTGQGQQIIPQGRLYSSGTTTTNPPTSEGSGNGLLGNYFNNQTLSGSPGLSRTEATINFTWDGNASSPFPGVNASYMSARWEGQVEAPVSGDYTFSTNNDDATNLWVNGQQLISDWPGGHGPLLKSGTIHLDANQKYAIKLEFNQGNGGAQAQLLWSYPGQGQQVIPQARLYSNGTTTTTTTNPPTSGGSGNGLLGNYFNNQTLSGSPALSRTDATINFSWNESGSPFPGVNATNMSARWEGQVEAPVSGDYTFSTNNDDATNLWVNGQQLISDWPGGHGALLKSGTIHLDANQKYSIKLEFNQGGGGAQAQLLWSYPGQGQQVIPQSRLYTTTGSGSGSGNSGGGIGNPTSDNCSVTSPRSNVEAVNEQGIYGWALDESDFGKTVMVDIYINGTKVASVPANDDRSDLVPAFGNNAAARYHGFSAKLTNLTYAPKNYSIAIQICGTANSLWSGQVNLSARTASTPTDGDDPDDTAYCVELAEVVIKAKKIKVVYPPCITKGTGSSSGGDSGSTPVGSPGNTQPPVTDIPPETTTGSPSTDPHNTGGTGTPGTGTSSNPTITNQPVPTKANLEGVDCDKISGWAFATNGGYADLDIYLTDPSGGSSGRLIKVATIKANTTARPDVRAANGNNPNIPLDCGFAWGIPDAYKTGQPLTVRVVPANNISSTGDIEHSPITSANSCSKPVTVVPGGATGKPLSWKDFPNFKDLSDQYFLDNYVLVGPKRPINIAERLNCFGTVPNDSKYKYSVTLYVDQPINGTREIADFTADDRMPGHTYLGFERYDTSNDQIIRLVVGYYVQSEMTAAMNISTASAWGDDGSTPYDVSLKVDLSASDFKNVIYNIKNLGNPKYNLVDNNCTTFACKVLSPYISLPDGKGYIGPLGKGYTPGDLGQDLRENKSAYGTKITVADNSTSPPSTNCN